MPDPRPTLRHRAAVWSLRVAGLVAVFGIWAYGTGPGGVSPLVLPSIEKVVEALSEIVRDPTIYQAGLVTLAEIVTAFLIAASSGLAVGFWVARTELRRRVYEPLLVWGYLAPMVLVYPIFILWLGTGPLSKVVFGAVGAFFPIAYSSVRGFATVDATLTRLASAFGASGQQTDRFIKLPAAMPLIAAGMRIGAAMALITVLLAEMLSATQGLGYELAKASQSFTAAKAFAIIAVLLVLVAIMQTAVQHTFRTRHERLVAKAGGAHDGR